MSSNNSAWEAFRAALGSDQVITHSPKLKAAETATYVTASRISALLYPQNTAEVQECLQIANTHDTPIYPISGGKNWGYGSKVPPQDGCALLMLQSLNKIRDYHEELGYVRIEAGVTFSQLRAFLTEQGSSLFIGSPGSTEEASIVAHTLERGITPALGPERALQVGALEVVLPDGSCIHTGMNIFPQAQAGNIHRWGTGPSTDGLFFQSNLGIVTAMTVWLPTRPKFHQQLIFSLAEEQLLTTGLPILQNLWRRGILPPSAAMYNATRFKAMLPEGASLKKEMQSGHWFITTAVTGESARHLRAMHHLLEEALAPLNGNFSLGKMNQAAPYVGTHARDGLKLAYLHKQASSGNDPDADGCGLIWCCPVVPFTKEAIRECLKIAKEVLTVHQFESLFTLQVIDHRCLYLIIPILFDRSREGDDTQAQSCHQELLTKLSLAGFFPYRSTTLDGSFMSLARPSYQAFLQQLKQSLDPNHILSPGRLRANT